MVWDHGPGLRVKGLGLTAGLNRHFDAYNRNPSVNDA